jgi:hypothetical protein
MLRLNLLDLGLGSVIIIIKNKSRIIRTQLIINNIKRYLYVLLND